MLLLLASAGIIGLLCLAAYLTIYIMDGSDISSIQEALETETETDAVATEPQIPSSEIFGSEDYQEKEHRFLFVGDSRTLGMQNAVNESDPSDSCTYIAKEGVGYDWFYPDGLDLLKASLNQDPNQTVILNLGVNDLESIYQYLNTYAALFSEYPQTSFYIMSVNPVDEEKMKDITNEQIQDFNYQMMVAFPTRFLDCYSYLLSEDFATVDGLHYSDWIYRCIHHYAVMILTA